MNIEESIERTTYRGFDLVCLREACSKTTRWHITQQEAGMSRNYGFAISKDDAHRRIDGLWPAAPR